MEKTMFKEVKVDITRLQSHQKENIQKNIKIILKKLMEMIKIEQ